MSKLGFLASSILAVSLVFSSPVSANDGGIGQTINQSSELLTLTNDANQKLTNSNYKIQFFQSEDDLYESKAVTHFESLPRDNKYKVGVYIYKQYNGSSTKVRYYVLADKDALNSGQASKYSRLVSRYDDKTVNQTAKEIESNFVAEFDNNPWTVETRDVLWIILLCSLGGFAIITVTSK
jgi:hypothetical protein